MNCGGDYKPVSFGVQLALVCIDCTRRKAGEVLVGEVVDGVCESKLGSESNV